MSYTIWFSGLSGSGKTTLSRNTFISLKSAGLKVELIDGDIVRSNFSQELSFTKRDRDINVKRIGFLSHLLNKHGVVSVVAAISPYADTRAMNRRLIDNYIEVFCDCPLDVVAARDPKGLYKRALAGEIQNFTGVSDPYEPPEAPEIHVRTDRETIAQSTDKVESYLIKHGILPCKCTRSDADHYIGEELAWRQRLHKLGFLSRLDECFIYEGSLRDEHTE
ncbi:adenylyl-sulfate kinase [Oceanidesulfovibrio indonesiensis]|uniref:Adenylyl-sulfate kinase n=1 Tax=Oceanidesulfovibrio indonesiensis TaxID=54767 RepID=A0A7M3MAS7_9BACT|nr:adenylyl-sulfate kinase [Oceanidesulfovibrio indonesiensis]TVM14367.1 adenylyl-sulfate kinase [Oceanidesulfovibrio indonesiensis]